MQGLYPILDMDALGARGIPPLAFARALLGIRPAFLQLRAKHLTARHTLELLRALGPLAKQAGTRLVANDRPDLGLLGGSDAVHLGQEDLPIGLVRQLGPELLVGVSTHTPEQLRRALAERPDYVAYGPVFETTSKQRPEKTVGLEGLRWAVDEAGRARCPLVAIGGIDLAKAREVGTLGCMGAVIAALIPPVFSVSEVNERARELDRALRREQGVNGGEIVTLDRRGE